MSDQDENQNPAPQLSPLQFSEPVKNETTGYYETDAQHTTDEGYIVRVHINCRDPHAIKRYWQSARVNFKVSLLTDAQQPNKGRSHRGKRVHNESTPPNAQLDDPTLDISINTDILQRHRLTFTIDPDIITNEIQAYRFPDVLEGSVTVTATGGSVSASFHGNKTESLLLDGKGNNNHPRSHRFAEEVADGKAVIFSLSVTGKQKGSQYTLDGDVTRGTSGGPQGRKFDPDHSSLPPH